MRIKQILRLNFLGCLLLFFLSNSLQASDLIREKELASAIEASLIVGDVVTLESDGASFLAIYTEPEGEQNQSVTILLHGLGGSPVQAGVIEPLRTGLPARGWGTLSLQLPILEAGAERIDYYRLIPAALNRIKAAVGFLEGKKIENIALVGHSMGAIMGSAYLASDPETAVSAAVMIGLFIPSTEQAGANVAEMLSRIDRPLLDLYGSRDLKSVLRSARNRQTAASGNRFYEQVEVNSANHIFRGLDNLLVSRVSGWLKRTVEATKTVPVNQIEKEKN